MSAQIVRRAGPHLEQAIEGEQAFEGDQSAEGIEGAKGLVGLVGLEALLARLYHTRGARYPEETRYPLSRLLPPSGLLGIDQAVQLLCAALRSETAILVVGDFDVDGATSTVLAVEALRAMGHQKVDFLVPNRFEYGYGLSPKIVQEARARGAELIITVDNGISSIDGVAAANAAGMAVLVTDHHLPGECLPAAAAIVNPNQPGCSFQSKAIAGVGVIFYVMTALRRALREQGWFEQRGIAEPNMAGFLDLVALGTVADVVPLDYNNRIFVQQGLQRIRAGRSRPGICALLKIGGRKIDTAVASDLGFAVGPRLNAAGRLDDMTHGILCLQAKTAAEADWLAEELDGLNRERREIEQGMQQEAIAHVERLDLSGQQLPFGLCLFDEGWHQGVVGILAARIRERYHRPVIAFADAGQGMIKGSARSVPGLHIRDTLDVVAAREPGVLCKFGGHAMAAGMELARADFDRFSRAFDRAVRDQLGEGDLKATVESDGSLLPLQLGLELAQLLRNAGPWGQHFPEPVFDGEFTVLDQRLVGKKHLKLNLALVTDPRHTLDAIWFNIDTAVWPRQGLVKAQVAYRLDVNEFRGFINLQLMVEQITPL